MRHETQGEARTDTRPRPKRKAIPQRVKDIVLRRQKYNCVECGVALCDGDRVEYDHRPPIILRPINVNGDDYHPPQNDPDHIDALHTPCHLKRTIGRFPGAEKTITTKGSDAFLAAKFRKLEGKNKPKRKSAIPSRPFAKTQRGFK